MPTIAEVMGRSCGWVKDAAGIEHPLYPLTLEDIADIESERGMAFVDSMKWLGYTAQGHRAVLWRAMRRHGLTEEQVDECCATGKWPMSKNAAARFFLAAQVEDVAKMVPVILKASGFKPRDPADPFTAAEVVEPTTATGSPTSSTPPSDSASPPAK